MMNEPAFFFFFFFKSKKKTSPNKYWKIKSNVIDLAPYSRTKSMQIAT